MEYDLAPCPFCSCPDVRVSQTMNDGCCRAAFCQACGARGPLRFVSAVMDAAAAGALAADDWNRVAEPFHEAIDDERIESIHIGLTEADKAEIDRIAATVREANAEEPATITSDDRDDDADDDCQGEKKAEGEPGNYSAETPQAPETAGGGSSEGAHPKLNGSPTVTERVRAFLDETGWTAKDFAHHCGSTPHAVTRLISGNAGKNAKVREQAAAFLDSKPTVAVKSYPPDKIQRLGTTWPDDPGANTLPKHEAPPRCSETP